MFVVVQVQIFELLFRQRTHCTPLMPAMKAAMKPAMKTTMKAGMKKAAMKAAMQPAMKKAAMTAAMKKAMKKPAAAMKKAMKKPAGVVESRAEEKVEYRKRKKKEAAEEKKEIKGLRDEVAVLKRDQGHEASPWKVNFGEGGTWEEWKEKGKEMGRMIVKDLRGKEEGDVRWGGRRFAGSNVTEWATEVVVEVTRWQMERTEANREKAGKPGKGVRAELGWVRERVEREAEEEAGGAEGGAGVVVSG